MMLVKNSDGISARELKSTAQFNYKRTNLNRM